MKSPGRSIFSFASCASHVYRRLRVFYIFRYLSRCIHIASECLRLFATEINYLANCVVKGRNILAFIPAVCANKQQQQ